MWKTLNLDDLESLYNLLCDKPQKEHKTMNPLKQEQIRSLDKTGNKDLRKKVGEIIKWINRKDVKTPKLTYITADLKDIEHKETYVKIEDLKVGDELYDPQETGYTFFGVVSKVEGRKVFVTKIKRLWCQDTEVFWMDELNSFGIYGKRK